MTSLFFFLFLLGVLKSTLSEQCACATSNVHVRSGPDTHHAVLTTLTINSCLPHKGSSGGWQHVDYHGRDGWISAKYVVVKACSSGGSNPVIHAGGCPRIISRSEWGARSPKSTHRFHGPAKYAFIHHGESGSCHTQTECSKIVRAYQNYHMDNRGWNDIGYSFLIGEDGNVYEGRGWTHVGSHTQHYNSVGFGFCMVGNFMNRVPNAAALAAVKSIIACGVQHGHLSTGYILKGHRDVGTTDCPGNSLYHLIRSWPHYS
ncbi:peptidoglycan recognition protein 1-like [Gigantopelta aegis]|uniref:peptidoglycan recognition protein 1-like n=1 Tax=Gigantopelta aegis TaxID=1735272 RepID=UPI001B88A394|nr:peptidoglycan recognition protein 1-like [Gigantopelta aegis]